MPPEEKTIEPKNKFVVWVKRLGFLGFLFFFVKGVLWLIIPFALVWFGTGG